MRALSFVVILAAFATASPAAAQWTPTAGPGHAGIAALLDRDGVLYAGTSSAGVWKSSNDGASWGAANAGIELDRILSFAANGAYLFAGTQQTQVAPGGVYRSSDQGMSWTSSGLAGMMIPSLYASESLLLAGTVGSGPFRSTDNGATWQPANGGMGNQTTNAIVACNGALFASGDNNLYRSTDGGLSWDFTNGGQFYAIFCMLVSGNTIYAGGHGGILRSTDGGASFEGPIWIDILPDLMRVTSFAIIGSDLYASIAGAPGVGVIRSGDGGSTWAFANGGIPNVNVTALASRGSNLLAGSFAKGLLRTTDGGGHWTAFGSGLPTGTEIRSLRPDGAGLLCGTGGDGPYRTNDAGASWTSLGSDPTGLLAGEFVRDLNVKGSVWLAATFASGIFRTTNAGASWEQSNQGLPVAPHFAVVALQSAGLNVIAGTSFGIFRSTNGGTSWTATNVSEDCSSLAWEPGFTYAIVNTGVFQTTGVYRSTNDGASWTLIFPTSSMTPSVIAAGDGVVYLGDLLAGMIRSTDHGLSWSGTPLSAGVFSLLPTGGTVYAGTDAESGGLFRSTDHGVSWSLFNEGLPGDVAVEALAADGAFLYEGDDVRGVWRRMLSPADAQSSWEASPLTLSEGKPNPVEGETVLDYELPRAGMVRIDLIDGAGRRVRTLLDSAQSAGAHTIRIESAGLAAGAYFCRISQGTLTASRRIVVVSR
jgi:hypothetical protein